MIALYYAAVGIITAYLTATIARFGRIPISISDTYYQWSEIGVKWLFTAVMWSTGLLILIYWVSAAEFYRCQFLSFLSISGMLFVGAACAKNESFTRPVHFASAGVWAGSAITFFAVNGMWPPIAFGALPGLVAMVADRFEHHLFWLELACVLMMVAGIGAL